MAQKKYVSLSKLSTFLDNLKTLFVTKTELSGKADSSHNHEISDVSELQNVLDEKADTSDLGFTRIVSCSSSDGVTYTGTTDGITSLTAGLAIIFVSSKTSASTTPTLNINDLGAKNIKRRLSHLSTSTQAGYSKTWLYANKPYFLIYDGTQWIVDGLTKPSAADLYGTLPIDKGGTGATTAAAALTNLGAALAVHTHEQDDINGLADVLASSTKMESGWYNGTGSTYDDIVLTFSFAPKMILIVERIQSSGSNTRIGINVIIPYIGGAYGLVYYGSSNAATARGNSNGTHYMGADFIKLEGTTLTMNYNVGLNERSDYYKDGSYPPATEESGCGYYYYAFG